MVSCMNHVNTQAEHHHNQSHLLLSKEANHNRMSISITMPSLSCLSSLGTAIAMHSPRKHHYHSRSKSMPSTLQLQTGHPILTEEFERLEESCSSSSSPCFGTDWLAQALEVLVTCYSNLSNTKMEAVLGSKWMNGHLDDILHLLEVCNLLRDTIAEIRKQNACVQAALRSLGPAPSPSAYAVQRARTVLSLWLSKKNESHAQLEKCISILRRMAEKVNVEDKAGAAIDVNHANAITIVICSTLVAALSFKTSHMRMPSLPLPSHFSCLHHKLKSEGFEMRKRSSRSLHELEAADVALANLNNLLNSKSKLHLSPSTLAFNELETALPLLEHKINKLFKSLISTRVALLNTLSSQ